MECPFSAALSASKGIISAPVTRSFIFTPSRLAPNTTGIPSAMAMSDSCRIRRTSGSLMALTTKSAFTGGNLMRAACLSPNLRRRCRCGSMPHPWLWHRPGTPKITTNCRGVSSTFRPFVREAAASTSLIGPFSGDHRRNRHQANLNVSPQALFLNILKIQLNPALKGNIAASFYLLKTSNTRDSIQPVEMGVVIFFHFTWNGWARANDAHITDEHVPELRDFARCKNNCVAFFFCSASSSRRIAGLLITSGPVMNMCEVWSTITVKSVMAGE